MEDDSWALGVIVGPSGSGKTSIGGALWPGVAIHDLHDNWGTGNAPIIDTIHPTADFDEITAALSAVGLGSVPSWLRPFSVLSNGEKYRAGLARVILDAPERIVIDEFTSVVDRQIARFGALAFQKAWKRLHKKQGCQAVLLSCHYDIIEWLEPDWVFDTVTGQFAGRSLWQRPPFTLNLWQTNWRYWPLFEKHHYLKLPHMVAATNYIGEVDGELVCHVAVSTRPGMKAARACRLVVMPEWQGAGVGMRFLNAVCQLWLAGENRYGIPMKTFFHTSHPGLAAALRRDPRWIQNSSMLYGGNKKQSAASIAKASGGKVASGYGGHFRAVQGFKYVGA